MSYCGQLKKMISAAPKYLPAVTFVVVEKDQKDTKIINIFQGGRCGAAWQMTDGSFGGTVNQMLAHEKIKNDKMDFLTKKFGEDKEKKGEIEYYLFLAREREKDVNINYSLINGLPTFIDVMQKVVLERSKVKKLILFSGDAVPLEWTEDPKIMARKVFNAYEEGLHSILKASEKSFRRRMPTKYRILSEAAVLSLDL
jgi:hypothetical protein